MMELFAFDWDFELNSFDPSEASARGGVSLPLSSSQTDLEGTNGR
jgi:hypothetical protein